MLFLLQRLLDILQSLNLRLDLRCNRSVGSEITDGGNSENVMVKTRGGARGGLGGYSSPVGRCNTIFRRFLAFIVL